MARFSADTVERVKAAADIVEIVSAHTDLRRRGERFVGLCPFHEERTPSFSVDAREKLYYCFGCEAGGDVIHFVEEKEGMGFPDAVEALAERYGVEVELPDPRAEEERRRRGRLYELLERTAAFYAEYLWESAKSGRAREYLRSRGLGEQVLRDFGVGFAPSAWDQVLTRGQRAGFATDELHAAGLVQSGRQGGLYDRFRSRIVFPVRDPRGRVVGFGARALTADQRPKYLNSPEGELYRKSHTLFGIDRARGPIARARRAILVEGYTDVLALHQAGFTEAVAVMGTAVTPEQLGMLAGTAERVLLALDADRAGQEAMVRAQKVAANREMEIRVLAMPADKDPCDLLQEESPERFAELAEAGVDLPTFQVNAVIEKGDLGSTGGRERALTEAVPVLAAMGETVGRDELMRMVADRLDVEPALVSQRVSAAVAAPAVARRAPAPVEGAQPPAPPAPMGARERRERALLAMCIALPGEGRGFLERLRPEHMSSPVASRAVEWLRGHADDPMAGLSHEDAELVSLVTQLVMTSKREPSSHEAMELNFMELDQRRLEDEIGAAREREDHARMQELSRERNELAERIRRREAVADG